MSKTKGQGGVEYLLTYLWAILVVTIVGVVMWQMGVFSFSGPEVTSSGFSKVKPQLASCKMSTSGNFSCLFTNALGGSLTINSIAVTAGSTPCTVLSPNPGAHIGVGENIVLRTGGCHLGAVPQAYVVDVALSYNLSVGGVSVTHNDTGEIKGPYEVA